MLPNESLLDVLHMLDYVSLEACAFATSAYYDLFTRNSELLPRLRLFECVDAHDTDLLHIYEVDQQLNRIELLHDGGQPEPRGRKGANLENAGTAIGSHPIVKATFNLETVGYIYPYVHDVIFDLLPTLKKAETVEIDAGNHTDVFLDKVLSRLTNLKSLSVRTRDVGGSQSISWLLQGKHLLALSRIEIARTSLVANRSNLRKADATAEKHLVETCFGSKVQSSSSAAHVSFLGWDMSDDFLKKILKGFKKCQRTLTVVFTRRNCDVSLNGLTFCKREGRHVKRYVTHSKRVVVLVDERLLQFTVTNAGNEVASGDDMLNCLSDPSQVNAVLFDVHALMLNDVLNFS